MPTTKRHPNASSVTIDGDKFRHFCWMHRTPLSHVGPMIGKCEGLASVLVNKGRVNYYTADQIATQFGLHVDDLLRQIGTAEELERLEVSA